MAHDALDQASLNGGRDFSSELSHLECPITQKVDIGIGSSSSSKFQKSRPVSSLPDELILVILLGIRCLPAPLATSTLACCSLVSHQWHRLTNPILYQSPMINMGSKRRANRFLNRLADEIIEYELDIMTSIKREPKPTSLIDQMKKLMFFGDASWRHVSSFETQPVLADRVTLHEILNRLWCTRIESLVFIELPFTTPFHQPLVNRIPTTLSTLVLLTPLSHFELLLILRNLPTLAHLCIGSHDDTSDIPEEHYTVFGRDQLPSPNLQSFGIAARTHETWLKPGMPWYNSILNLIILPSVRSITSLHMELIDEDDECHILSILSRPPPIQESQSAGVLSTVTRSSTEIGNFFKLENVFLRGFSSAKMSESLAQLEGIRKLCLSSLLGTALRFPNSSFSTENLSIQEAADMNDAETRVTEDDAAFSNADVRSLRMLSKNYVWESIPTSIQELSIEITRLPAHGPWNKRSSDQLTCTLTHLIRSGQCPHLRKLGSLLAEMSFQFGIYGLHRDESPVVELLQAAATHGVSLVPSFWSDSFVTNSLGTNWYP